LKMSGSRPVGHITSREEMGSLEGRLVGCEEMVARRWDVVGRGLGRRSMHSLCASLMCHIFTHWRKVIT